MIYTMSALNHPRSLTSLRLTTDEFDQQSEKDFSLCHEFGGELLK